MGPREWHLLGVHSFFCFVLFLLVHRTLYVSEGSSPRGACRGCLVGCQNRQVGAQGTVGSLEFAVTVLSCLVHMGRNFLLSSCLVHTGRTVWIAGVRGYCLALYRWAGMHR